MFVATPFARYVAESLGEGNFDLLDIGTNAESDAAFHAFGSRLRARSLHGRLELADEAVGADRLQTGRFWDRNPWDRLSVARTMRSASTQDGSREPGVEEALILPQALCQDGYANADFIRLSTGGSDFVMLLALERYLEEAGVLGIALTVNFYGSGAAEAHTFHNVDRFMKGCGFELFSLSVRRYSMAALPAPYVYSFAAESAWGRVLQGEALYLRDAASPEQARFAVRAGPLKLAKLAALFSMANLPDCAAEVLIATRLAIQATLDIDHGLELLVAQSTPEGEPLLSYADYMKSFDAQDDRFFPARLKSRGTDTGVEPQPTMGLRSSAKKLVRRLLARSKD